MSYKLKATPWINQFPILVQTCRSPQRFGQTLHDIEAGLARKAILTGAFTVASSTVSNTVYLAWTHLELRHTRRGAQPMVPAELGRWLKLFGVFKWEDVPKLSQQLNLCADQSHPIFPEISAYLAEAHVLASAMQQLSKMVTNRIAPLPVRIAPPSPQHRTCSYCDQCLVVDNDQLPSHQWNREMCPGTGFPPLETSLVGLHDLLCASRARLKTLRRKMKPLAEASELRIGPPDLERLISSSNPAWHATRQRVLADIDVQIKLTVQAISRCRYRLRKWERQTGNRPSAPDTETFSPG